MISSEKFYVMYRGQQREVWMPICYAYSSRSEKGEEMFKANWRKVTELQKYIHRTGKQITLDHKGNLTTNKSYYIYTIDEKAVDKEESCLIYRDQDQLRQKGGAHKNKEIPLPIRENLEYLISYAKPFSSHSVYKTTSSSSLHLTELQKYIHRIGKQITSDVKKTLTINETATGKEESCRMYRDQDQLRQKGRAHKSKDLPLPMPENLKYLISYAKPFSAHPIHKTPSSNSLSSDDDFIQDWMDGRGMS